MRRGAVGAHVWEVLVFCHAHVVCIVCVWCASCGSPQCCVLHDCSLLMLVEDARGNHMEEAYPRCIGSHGCLLLFAPCYNNNNNIYLKSNIQCT